MPAAMGRRRRSRTDRRHDSPQEIPIMAVYPTSPRDAFLNWCRDHIKVFALNPASIGLTPAQAATFSEAYQSAFDAVGAQGEARLAAQAATDTATAGVSSLRKSASDTVKLIKTYASTTNNPAVYALAQIPAPDAPSPVPAPGQPTNITVGVAPTSGAITLKWKCVNPPGASGTSYIVRRRTPGQTAFQFVGVTGKKSFTDGTFAAGPDRVEYTIQAQRSDKAGPVSNILVINFGAASMPVPGTAGRADGLKMAA